MAQFVVKKLSDLGDRWDAGFHIALDEVKDRVRELKDALTPEEAIERLKVIPLQDKEPLMVLVRGQARVLNTATVDRVSKDYPYLALAIMEKNLKASIERIRAKIAKDQASLDALLAIQPSPDDEPSAPGP